jgi:transaldolase
MPATASPPPIKLFMDGADIAQMKRAYGDPRISGFTTNPTLMRKAGITDYAAFAQGAIAAMPDKPISFEVFSDTPDAMEREARVIHGWGGDTYVKIPVTNTAGQSCAPLIRKLSAEGIALNVTAIMTLAQVSEVADALDPRARAIVSVFAGRIADTGVDPEPLMRSAVELLRGRPAAELLWASPRELLNLYHAARVGCHIITATSDVLGKLGLIGKDLTEYSLETVRMFHTDAVAAGFRI